MEKQCSAIRILILSRNLYTVETICAAAQKLSIRSESSSKLEEALVKLSSEKFEGVVFDFGDFEDPVHLTELLRMPGSNRRVITFALTSERQQASQAARLGIHFVLRWPLEDSELRRTMRAALPLLLRERRRYFRCPIVIPVLLDADDFGRIAAKSKNISEGGMAIESQTVMSVGTRLIARFELPGSETRMNFNARVCWTKEGLMGIQFAQVPTGLLAILQSWLSDRVEQSLPAGELDQLQS